MMSKSTHAASPFIVDEPNISRAWAKVALHILDHSGTEVSPLILSVSGFNDSRLIDEHPDVHAELDAVLQANGHQTIEDVAHTIFPQRIWKIAQGDRAYLFRLYQDVFNRYQVINKRANGRGLYFERLIQYGSGPCDGNQLEWILDQYHSRKGVRDSMYQASIFDPGRDHVATAQLQFPCLQHVSFVPTQEGLVVNAFYATQQLFVKGYGNYLGIARLGAFMAHEMCIPLHRMNVFVGVAKLERIHKTDASLHPLIDAARACLATPHAAEIVSPSVTQEALVEL